MSVLFGDDFFGGVWVGLLEIRDVLMIDYEIVVCLCKVRCV